MIDNKKGFSFIETLISIFFISMVIVPAFSYFVVVTRENYDIRMRNDAVYFASDVLESYIPGSYIGSREYEENAYMIKEKSLQARDYYKLTVNVDYKTSSGRSSVRLSKYYEK